MGGISVGPHSFVSLVGADLAGGNRGHLCSLGRAGHIRLICHGFATHCFHDAAAELEKGGEEVQETDTCKIQ